MNHQKLRYSTPPSSMINMGIYYKINKSNTTYHNQHYNFIY
ncbi:hypothetical protein SBY92_002282 [Candida maltosa Xu316]